MPRRIPIAALAAAVTLGSLAFIAGCDTRLFDVSAVQRSPNGGLASLATSAGTLNPAFDSRTFSYNLVVDSATTSVTFTPTQAENGETITVNGFATASGQASEPVTLSIGPNPVTIVTTASDGTTTRTYTITVTRMGT
jgi:Cadherin-like beta sandwich domain